MPRGGRRPGAGRKPGTRSRPKPEIETEKALNALKRAARAAAAEKRQEDEDRARREREARREAQAEKVKLTVLPPMETPDVDPNALPLDFLIGLMRDVRLPMTFRRDCAALALPFAHARPILGLKDARRLAAFDDDDDDPIAAVMRGN